MGVLQCECCSMLQCECCSMLQCVAVCCRMFQGVDAVCCGVLRCVAVCCKVNLVTDLTKAITSALRDEKGGWVWL